MLSHLLFRIQLRAGASKNPGKSKNLSNVSPRKGAHGFLCSIDQSSTAAQLLDCLPYLREQVSVLIAGRLLEKHLKVM